MIPSYTIKDTRIQDIEKYIKIELTESQVTYKFSKGDLVSTSIFKNLEVIARSYRIMSDVKDNLVSSVRVMPTYRLKHPTLEWIDEDSLTIEFTM